eukprot:10441977-Prorocentrum_lima.AAC.1
MDVRGPLHGSVRHADVDMRRCYSGYVRAEMGHGFRAIFGRLLEGHADIMEVRDLRLHDALHLQLR